MSPIDSKQFPDAPFPASYASEFRVHFDPDIYQQIQKHVCTDTSHEVGGILVGLWKKDKNGPYATITAMIRCDKAVGKEGEVTFTHETWNDIAHEMDGPYVDLQIVGWYHSHPGFGVFLSERDLFIQEHFFSNPGQVALVIDPISETEGVFFWKDGKIVPGEQFWVGQKMSLSQTDNVDAGQHPKKKLSIGTGTAGMREASDLPEPPQPVFGSSWFSFLVILTICMAMFVLGGLLKPSDGPDYRQRLLQGALYDYCFVQGKRPGLENYLFRINRDLHEAKLEAGKLLGEADTNDAKKDGNEKAPKNRLILLLPSVLPNCRATYRMPRTSSRKFTPYIASAKKKSWPSFSSSA